MKTAKALVGRVFGCLAMLAICAFASPAAFGEMDITAYMRSLGNAAYSIEAYGDTVVLDGSSANYAVDGIYGKTTTTGSSRVLFARTVSGNTNPCDLKYSLCTHSGTNFVGKVTSFTLYRLNTGNASDLTRAPKRFSLYGSNDGDNWTLLYETAGDVAWSETIYVTCQIPAERQMMYSQYRFKVGEPTDVTYVGYHELILNGEVYASRVWTGDVNSNWNSSDANWTGNTGAAPLWGNAEIGVFGGGASSKAVSVDAGGVALRGISVLENGYSISGGDLNVMPASQFDTLHPVTVSSDVVDVVPSATAAQAEYLPYTADKSTGTWVKLWENRLLAATTFTGAYFKGGTYVDGSAIACQAVAENDRSVSVQFQYLPQGNSGPLFCIKAEFKQVGRDVWGRAVYSSHSMKVKDGSGELGDDFDSYIEGTDKFTAKNLDQRNIKDIAVVDLPAPLRFNIKPSVVEDCYSGSCLPRSESSAKVGEEVLCWEDRSLKDLDAIDSFSFYDGNSRIAAATLHYFQNDGETASFQLQYNRAPNNVGRTARLCVKVELRQDGADIRGRVAYAKYHWYEADEEAVVMDFDPVTTGTLATNVRDDSHASDGYGAGDLCARFRSRMRIDGDFGTAQNIEINGGVLSLGASSLSLAQDVSGTGILEFSPESGTQTISVGADAAATIAAGRFSGTVTLEVAKGGAISFGSVAFADDAVVNLVVPSGAAANHSVRVGTSAALTKTELAHFQVGGKPVKIQTDDGWLVAGTGGLTIIFR